MQTEIPLLRISSQSSTDVVGFWIFSAERENICSPLFTTSRTICTNRILQITSGVAGSRGTQTPAFFTDSVVLLKLTGLLTCCKSNTELNSYFMKSHQN